MGGVWDRDWAGMGSGKDCSRVLCEVWCGPVMHNEFQCGLVGRFNAH